MEFKEMEGVRLKFRTRGGWVVAFVEVDGDEISTIATIDERILSGDNDDYRAWIDAVTALWGKKIADVIGELHDSFKVKRRAVHDP